MRLLTNSAVTYHEDLWGGHISVGMNVCSLKPERCHNHSFDNMRSFSPAACLHRLSIDMVPEAGNRGATQKEAPCQTMLSAIAISHLQARPQVSPALYVATACRTREIIPFQSLPAASAVVPDTFARSRCGSVGYKRSGIIRHAVQSEKGSIAGPAWPYLHFCHAI